MNAKTLVVLHGCNLDMLGARPSAHYGTITLPQLEELITREVSGHGWNCECHQTNHEGTFIDLLHQYRSSDAVLVNPGAWTHYSYGIRDALEIVKAPIAEVHLSDISSREPWRRHSVISEVVSFTIAGQGPEGYLEAARRLIAMSVE